MSNGRQIQQLTNDTPSFRVDDLIAQFWIHAKQWYQYADGTQTRELVNIRIALQPLHDLYGPTNACDFAPPQLKALREHLLHSTNQKRDADGLCRNVINQRIGIVKRVFRWGVEEGMLPTDLYHGLAAVRILAAGRTRARETAPVKPVTEADMRTILPFVSPHIAAMIQLQWLTGMRPGEVARMRLRDLDTSQTTWIYTPQMHKTQHLGKVRTIPLGSQAREIVKQFLTLDRDAYFFSPARSQAARRTIARANRKQSEISRWQIARDAANRRSPRERLNELYSSVNYRQAISRACAKVGIPNWSPNQLRHSAATRIRKQYGLEFARILLGHASATTTEIYAEVDKQKAIEIAEECG
ncbi:MAG: tyrosine-type recombinase/integrase [Planctomycetes bacterium]|nr:tyrosine-type recombinase/integrase [Planctomycetota bacterium]